MKSFYEETKSRTLEHLPVEKFTPHALDLAYGDAPDEVLDLYWPEENGGLFPVILQIHGGGWVYGDKSMSGFRETLTAFLKKGFAVASMRYTLSPEAVFPLPCTQVSRAIRFLRRESSSLRLQRDALFLFGNSAGGYLALYAALTEPGIRAAAAMYGITDPAGMGRDFRSMSISPRYLTENADSMEGLFLGGDVRTMPETAEKADLKKLLSRNMPPLLLQHGTADKTVPYLQSCLFSREAEKFAGGRVTLELYKGMDHSEPFFKSQKNGRHIAAYFKQFLTGK